MFRVFRSAARVAGLALVTSLSTPLLVTQTLAAQTPVLDPAASILPPDVSYNERFGRFPVAEGTTLVVGSSAGAAFVYEQTGANNWTLRQTLTPSYTPDYWYAIDLELDGGTLALGDGQNGVARVEILRQSGATFTPEFTVLSPAADRERFGSDFALSGDDLVVRSRRNTEVVLDHFVRQADGTWPLFNTWTRDTGSSYAFGGTAIQGDQLFIGFRTTNENRGEMVVFDRDAVSGAFVPDQVIVPSGLQSADFFGDQIAVDGNLLAVSSGFTDNNGSNSGSAWIYERDATGTWTQIDYLVPSTAGASDMVGSYLALDGNRLAVSGRSLNGSDIGSYLFERQGDGSFAESRLRFSTLTGLSWGGRGLAIEGDAVYTAFLDTQNANYGHFAAYYLGAAGVPPTVQINSVNACVFSADLTVSGTVTSNDSPSIDTVVADVNGGIEQPLCTNCGAVPAPFSGTVALDACDNTVTVSATDADGLLGSSSVFTRFDVEGPTVTGCPDDIYVNGSQVTVPFPTNPQATDNCDASVPVPTCRRWDDQPETSTTYYQYTTPVSCRTADSCNRPGSCSYTVTVLPTGVALPGDGCEFFEFRHELDYSFPFSQDSVGAGLAIRTEADNYAGTWMRAEGIGITSTGDNGGFFSHTEDGDFRIQSPLIYRGGNSSDLGGLMVRWGLGAAAPRVSATVRANDGTVDFRVREADGAVDQLLATGVPVSQVTDVAIEVEGDRVTVQYSSDGGHTWTVPGGELGGAHTVAKSGSAQAGYFVASGTDAFYTDMLATWATICPALGVDPGEGPEPPTDPGDVVTGCQTYDLTGNGGDTPFLTLGAIGDAAGVQDALSLAGSTLTAASSDLFHGQDNAGFHYLELENYGDFRVEMPFPFEESASTQTYQKAGLMVRYGLDPLAPRMMVMSVPNHPNGPSVQFDVRTASGATATEAGSTISSVGADLLAIEKVGNILKVQVSYDDGASWVQPLGGTGGAAAMVTSGNPLVGLAVASYDLTTPVSYRIPELTVCGEDDVAPPPPIEPVDGCLNDPMDDGHVDSGWSLLSMGDADQVSVAESDSLELSGDGSTLFSSGTDHGAFLYRAVSGDFRAETVVDVSEMSGTGAYRKAGLMLRAGLGDQAVRFMAQLAPAWNNDPNRTALQFRYRGIPGARGDLTWASNRDYVAKQVHLAIERKGDTFTTFYSLDGGVTWIQPVGGVGGSVTVAGLPDTMYIGLNTVSYDPAEAVTAKFRNFQLCAPAAVGGLLWWDQDADTVQGQGERGLPGVQMELRTTSNQPIFTTYTDDDGRFLFPNVDPGDYILLIDWALGLGTNYEATVDPDGLDIAEYAIISVAPGQQYLDADFGFRVTGNLADFNCGHESDSFDDGTLADFWFEHAFGDADQVSVAESGGTLQVSGDGSSLYAGPDHGAFVFNHFTGNFRVEVDVDGMDMTAGGPYRKAGLMVRTGFADDDPRYIAQLVPYWENGTAAADSVLQFRYRATKGGQSDVAWGSNIEGAPRQVRLAIQRVGDTLSTEYSYDGGATWLSPSGGALGSTTNPNLPDTLLVGMNVVSYDAAIPATAEFDNFDVCRLP